MAIYSRYKLKTGEEVDYFPPIQNTDNPYATEAAMYADQANQLQGYGYLVTGVGAFTYLGTVAETAADYEGNIVVSSGTAVERTRKEVSATTQYTLIAADFTDFYLDFTANGGQTISLILNAGVMPDNGELRAISSGNNFIVPTVGTGTVIFIKPDSANLKTVPFAWFGIVKATAADTYSVNGSLESNVVAGSSDIPTLQQVTEAGSTTTEPIIINNGGGGVLKLGTATILGSGGQLVLSANSTFGVSLDSLNTSRFRVRDGKIEINTVSQGSTANRVNLNTALITSERIQQFPDKSGTLALIDDIGLDLRASNLAGDLSTAEKDGIKTKLDFIAKTKTGTSLDLSNVVGNNYNYAAFSSATTYTTTTPVINGFARCFINAASQPTVTGATYLTAAGDVFQSNTEMEMVVESPNGTIVEFYFLKR